MRRTLIITMVIWWALSKIAPIGAEDIFIMPHSPTAFLLKQYDTSPIYIPKLETKSIKLIQTERNLDDVPLSYLKFNTVYVLPLKLKSHDELLDSYAQILRLERAKTQILQSSVPTVDHKYIKAFLNPPKVDEEKLIRQQWREFFGMDVWYPYYKAKEIEDWVKEKFRIKIWKFKGKPRFRRDRVDYIFKMKF